MKMKVKKRSIIINQHFRIKKNTKEVEDELQQDFYSNTQDKIKKSEERWK
jgi:hypothetical protein